MEATLIHRHPREDDFISILAGTHPTHGEVGLRWLDYTLFFIDQDLTEEDNLADGP